MMVRWSFWLPPALALVAGMAVLQHYAEAGMRLARTSQVQTQIAKRSWATMPSQRSDSSVYLAAASDTLPPRSPFGAGRPNRPALSSLMPRPPVVRPLLVLKGTVGGQVATLIDAAGVKSLVKPGEKIDSAEVIRIMPGKVILRDRHGTFEVTSQDRP
jgi:hypothetical protein